MFQDLTTSILNVLNRLKTPTEVDEIAFRVRSTPTIVKEHLELLYDAHLVKKTDDTHFEIVKDSNFSSWKSLFSY